MALTPKETREQLRLAALVYTEVRRLGGISPASKDLSALKLSEQAAWVAGAVALMRDLESVNRVTDERDLVQEDDTTP